MSRSRKHRRTVTSEDVAEFAGVSRATISAVVNKSRYVSEELVERVEEAIRVLGYKPNVVARSLKTQRTNTIGLVIPNVLSPVWTQTTRSVELRARELGFSTIICDTDEDPDTERDCVHLLTTRQVDGIIIAPCSMASEEYLRPLVAERAILFAERQPYSVNASFVSVDKFGGARTAVLHLIERGAKRVGIVTSMIRGQEALLDHEWVGGYKQALRESGLPIDEALIRVGRRGRYSESDGCDNAVALLQLPERPDAILACTHFITMGVLRGARSLGVRIPGDLALVGYDDVIYNEYISPTLSVISQPWGQLGCLAVELLVKQIVAIAEDGAPPEPEGLILPVELIVRESSTRARH